MRPNLARQFTLWQCFARTRWWYSLTWHAHLARVFTGGTPVPHSNCTTTDFDNHFVSRYLIVLNLNRRLNRTSWPRKMAVLRTLVAVRGFFLNELASWLFNSA